MPRDSKPPAKALSAEKKGYHHGDLRQVLIDQAAQIIREEGEAALSMRKLAARTGVSRTAPYHHFEDKQDLLCAVAEEGFRRFDELIGNRPERDNLLSYMQAHVRGYVKFAVENSEYYDLMFSSHIWTSNKISESLKRRAHASFRTYADVLAELSDTGKLPEGVNAVRFAQVSWSTLHGLSRLMIDGIYVDQDAADAICDAAAKMLVPQVT